MIKPYSEKYDVFLSYRRDGGETMAILLRDRLTARGYRVFLDIESLNSGSFNEKLLEVIESCADFVVVCSRGCLDRCASENDWVRMEIAHAMKHKRNIVPIMLRGFEWPDTLPDDIDALRIQNGINAESNEYFDAAIDRLVDKFLTSVPKTTVPNSNPESQAPAFLRSIAINKIQSAKVLGAAAIFLIISGIIGLVFLSNTDSGTPEESITSSANINQENRKDILEENAGANISAPEAAENAEPTTMPVTTAPPATQVSESAFDSITINGVEYRTALYELDLSNRDLTNTDIATLRYMKNIEILNLGGNQISDLSPLTDLTSLKRLSLYDNNRISDLAPLKNLTNLTMLSLYFNPISDITVLSGLTKLEELHFGENQISDLTPLSGLTNLRILGLDDNRVSDLTPISSLVNLTELSLNRNQINDLKPISGLTNLVRLELSRNQISDLTPLSGLTNLRNLSLSDNQINNWSPVEHVRAVFGRP